MTSGLFFLTAATLPLLGPVLLLARGRLARRLFLGTLGLAMLLALTGLAVLCLNRPWMADGQPEDRTWAASASWLRLSEFPSHRPVYGGEGEGGGPGGMHAAGMEHPAGTELRVGFRVDHVVAVFFLVQCMIGAVIVWKLRRGPLMILTAASVLWGISLHLILADNLIQILFWWAALGLGVVLAGFKREGDPILLRPYAACIFCDGWLLIGAIALWHTLGTVSLVGESRFLRDLHGNIRFEDGVPATRIDRISLQEAMLALPEIANERSSIRWMIAFAGACLFAGWAGKVVAVVPAMVRPGGHAFMKLGALLLMAGGCAYLIYSCFAIIAQGRFLALGLLAIVLAACFAGFLGRAAVAAGAFVSRVDELGWNRGPEAVGRLFLLAARGVVVLDRSVLDWLPSRMVRLMSAVRRRPGAPID